jgi:nitroimidazol reductase NimA-like FMN-containing flavoprotein (pyridoxamine 5'-phosphate oxidase superfamily)
MDIPTRDEFLREPRVAVVAVARDGDPPLVVPVWFEYEAEIGFVFVMGGRSVKAGLLSIEKRASVCVQDDRTAYRYVVADGPVSVTPIAPEELRTMWLPTVERYLGAKAASEFLDEFDEPDPVVVVLSPHRWRSAVFDEIPIASTPC